MKHLCKSINPKLSWMLGFTVMLIGIAAFSINRNSSNNQLLTYEVDPKTQNIQFYWKNENGEIFRSIKNLKTNVESKNKKLVFAMNAGMYRNDNSPQGLFIQNHKIITPIDTTSGNGNFYLKPNGVFYINDNNDAFVCSSSQFAQSKSIKFASQSGPMLVVNGEIHPAFKKGSSNVNIRNGVGILKNKKILFAMSKSEINLHDFALYFKNSGCEDALYLDGFVSRTYLPEKNWMQTDGNFGVMIGVTQ